VNQIQHTKKLILVGYSTAATSNATISASLDTRGWGYCVIDVVPGAKANTDADGVTISLLESDDTVVTNHATITADLSDKGDTSDADMFTYFVDLKGRKRYLRLTVTTGTAGTNEKNTVCAFATLLKPAVGPTNTTDMVDNTTDQVITIV
jgi:hypothetical protein